MKRFILHYGKILVRIAADIVPKYKLHNSGAIVLKISSIFLQNLATIDMLMCIFHD